MSRRLDISSLLCDEPPPKERVREEIVPEPVLLAPHLRRNAAPEQSLDTLVRAAAMAEKQQRDPSFANILRSPVEDLHRPTFQRPRYEQQQQQQQLLLLQQQQRQQEARQREHHEQMMHQERLQAQRLWEQERDAIAAARKPDAGQLLPTPPSASHSFPPRMHNIPNLEPPSKKRRYSEEVAPFDTPSRMALSRSAIRRPSSSSSSSGHETHPFSFGPRPILDNHGIQTPPFPPAKRSPPGSSSGRAKAARKPETEVPDVTPYVAERRDYTVIHLPERQIEDYLPDDRKHKRASSYRPPSQQQQRPAPPPQQRRPSSASHPKEEDPHEWLLEHYADASPHERPRHKPEPPPSPQHVFASQKAVDTPPSAPMPIPSSKSKVEDVEMGVSNLLVSDPGKTENMDVDVEDELLSLVDDRPRSRSITQPPSMSRVSSGSKRLPNATEPNSPHASPTPSALPSSALPESESMPPPASTASGQSKKKKEATKVRCNAFVLCPRRSSLLQPPPKPKATTAAKPRAKPAPKAKAKVDATVAKAKPSAISRKSGSAAASASRSRSTSAMPGGSVGPDGSEKPEDEEEEVVAEDDKLYCVCKTKYDEDRFMIACDKCDEWYHTQCVEMPDLVVDLVDQFFCPLCIEKNPNLSLKTTYKPRCRYGLDHPEPDSPTACHKPAQGAFSKYCSPECGMNNIKKRIDKYTKNGGKKEMLWDSVFPPEVDADGCLQEARVVSARVKPEEVANLNAVLEEVVTQRETVKEGMDIVLWRERLLELASERAERVGQCGWDQRLCFGEEEWAEFGGAGRECRSTGEDWWCLGSERCERHSGWQTIRAKDVSKEREKKEEALFRLTTRERELRKRIEDIVEPYNRSCINPTPFKASKLVNGNAKGKANGDNKKGKKRKNPS
ncbi:hypothetical protein FB45DRAFT_917282 [Roridomyces roridus]|uniref:PHD-type domain-containing protein n=1 Tax=Roridomyces roridus TaxID=1738132 RepID=A0AAD7FLF0_9AGAR|nr:hypothetical protein FB45DRAFT_917282 [Roridomyces roridus]